jgi:hypothetical protein
MEFYDPFNRGKYNPKEVESFHKVSVFNKIK